MEILMASLVKEWQSFLQILPRIAFAILIFALSMLVGRILSRGFMRFIESRKISVTHSHFIKTSIVFLFVIIGLILALNVLGLRGLAGSLLAGGGVTAIILGFAFREIGENFLAGFVLAFNRPFDVGNLIESEDLQGEVKGIELRHTHIRTADGCDIFIPSAQIINRPLINFTRDGLRRPSFNVGIDYADDSALARKIILEQIQATDGVLKSPPPTVTVSTLTPQYVELEICFWIDTFDKSISLPQVRTDAMEKCRQSLMQGGFTVSSNVTTNLDISRPHPIDFRLIEQQMGK